MRTIVTPSTTASRRSGQQRESETHELAVMRDSVYPLKLTKFAKEFDDGNYACSGYENAQDVGAAAGAGPTSCF